MKEKIQEWRDKDKKHNLSELHRRTGITYKQIWHYSAGYWKPCEANKKKILAVVDNS